MKLLLYCTKAKPYLFGYDKQISSFEPYTEFTYDLFKLEDIEIEDRQDILNGKIVAECDFEVEEIFRDFIDGKDYTINPKGVWVKSYYFKTKTLYESELYNNSCLTFEQMYKYFDDKDDKLVGYAIHIKNLHIFDEAKELSDYSRRLPNGDFQVLGNAPQNMMKCCEIKYIIKDYILISIRPEWLCKILNGEKTIEVRKKVLKEMLE